MRYGVLILPEQRWEQACETWRSAEALGFAHAWTYDHLTWRSLRDGPWFAAIPTLTAAACATSSIRLGTLVSSPNFREPAPFAKELLALDDISGGRLTLGFGAGADGFDATATRPTAWQPAERQVRFAEFVEALDLLLRNARASFAGDYYVANEARAIPPSRQPPRIPFALAGTGPRSMRVVARHAQTWVAVDSRGAGREQIDLLRRACEAEGRDPDSIARLVLVGHATAPLQSVDAFRRVADRYTDDGFTDLVLHWPRVSEPFQGSREVLERIAPVMRDASRTSDNSAAPSPTSTPRTQPQPHRTDDDQRHESHLRRSDALAKQQ